MDLIICEICGNTFTTNRKTEVCNDCLSTKQVKTVKHPDAWMKSGELKKKLQHLKIGQEYAAAKYEGVFDVNPLLNVIEKINSALEKRTNKKSMLDLITLNSAASRYTNNKTIDLNN